MQQYHLLLKHRLNQNSCQLKLQKRRVSQNCCQLKLQKRRPNPKHRVKQAETPPQQQPPDLLQAQQQPPDPRLWPEYSGWRCRVRPPQLEKADMAKAEGRRATAGGWSEGCRSNRSNRSTIYQLTDHYYHPKKNCPPPPQKKSWGGDLQMAP